MKIKFSFKNMEEGLPVYMTSLMEYLVFFLFFIFIFIFILNYLLFI